MTDLETINEKLESLEDINLQLGEIRINLQEINESLKTIAFYYKRKILDKV